jgi:multiple sugar transport system ATP-binding protein
MTLADRIAIMKGGIIQQLDTPQVIYNKPVNLYVAGFVGSPSMNFLSGTLEGGTSPHILIDNEKVQAKDYEFAEKPTGSQKVILGVRPEHMVIGDAGSAMPFSTMAEIEIVEPTGADTLAWTKIGNQPVTFRCDSEVDLKVGQTLPIGFDIGRCSIFDKESGDRL